MAEKTFEETMANMEKSLAKANQVLADFAAKKAHWDEMDRKRLEIMAKMDKLMAVWRE